ncbi:MAG: hypothetical protein AAF153_02435, partial [Pseudomonadota bacterium]
GVCLKERVDNDDRTQLQELGAPERSVNFLIATSVQQSNRTATFLNNMDSHSAVSDNDIKCFVIAEIRHRIDVINFSQKIPGDNVLRIMMNLSDTKRKIILANQDNVSLLLAGDAELGVPSIDFVTIIADSNDALELLLHNAQKVKGLMVRGIAFERLVKYGSVDKEGLKSILIDELGNLDVCHWQTLFSLTDVNSAEEFVMMDESKDLPLADKLAEHFNNLPFVSRIFVKLSEKQQDRLASVLANPQAVRQVEQYPSELDQQVFFKNDTAFDRWFDQFISHDIDTQHHNCEIVP